MKDHASTQPFQMFRKKPREWVELFWYLSRDSGDSSDIIIPHRSRILQWSCHLLNWKGGKKKKPKLKNTSLIDELKLKL